MLTAKQTNSILAGIKEHGTLRAGYEAAGISEYAFMHERNRSAIFRRRVAEALKEGKERLGDIAVENIKGCAVGEVPMGKTQLTANIALANAYAAGFKTQRVEQHISAELTVSTAVPRPKYDELEKITVEGELKELPEGE